ncbi:MAG: zinc ribbon domain-containing protein [Promethearchaeota archaeon]
MISKEMVKEQLRGSLEVIIATIAMIIGSILTVLIVADTIGDRIVTIINDNYGPLGLFNLGLPDLFWVLLLLAILSFTVKIAVSLLMPIVLPFYGYCPKCGVKPLPEENQCSECGCNLYRKRISSFDVKMYVTVTTGFAIFVAIWYFLSLIVGVRMGVDPGI